MINEFTYHRFFISCELVQKLINSDLVNSNEWYLDKNKFDTTKVIYKGSFMDCIECFYVTIPAVLVDILKSKGFEFLTYYDKKEKRNCKVNVDKANWAIVIKSCRRLKILDLRKSDLLFRLLSLRGLLIHSIELSSVEYYEKLIIMINIVRDLDSLWLKDFVKSNHRIGNYVSPVRNIDKEEVFSGSSIFK